MLGTLVTACLSIVAAVLIAAGICGTWLTRPGGSAPGRCGWFAVLGWLGILLGVLCVCQGVAHEQSQQEIRDLREYIRRI